MRVRTFFYCLRQGLKNICRNIWFSLASVATISACIFLFCLFFSIIANVQHIVKNVEQTVGVTVLFDEDLTEEQILALGEEIGRRSEIREMTYVSAEEAWDSFRDEYFAGREELAEGFAEDNPLAGSASYEIYLNDISEQETFVEFLESLPGVRQVNYSNTAATGLISFNRVVSLLSVVIIGVLLAVSVFLINNTISVAAAFRRQESQIMRLIGATNFMIRAPFLVEGVVIGLIGALIPLAAMYFLYTEAVEYVVERFRILSDSFYFMPITEIYPQMVVVAFILGVGIGFFGSFFTIRKYLRV
ncbi:MAG: permease-like cell division protein FtsX [Clostridiales bacterium]|nr:permease-like cell division protein FtsX [Clostridiales bacterium]MCD8368983.1 permease-like cell division protein FtsX [Clostridiales bacterium]